MNFKEIYNEKLTTPQEMAQYIKSGFICAAPSCLAQPTAIIEAISERARKGEIEGVESHGVIAMPGGICDADLAGKFTHVSWFTSGAARAGTKAGYIDYVPAHYSYIPGMWTNSRDRLDVVYLMVSPMDSHGYFSMGVTASENIALIEKADKVFVEVNKYMPRTHGVNFIHVSKVDSICEFDQPLGILPSGAMSENDIKMGNMIASEIPNGATIQLGIGGIPNAVGSALMGKQDLGIHTEMFTDSMVDLIEAGVVNNDKKAIHRGKTIAAFGWGSQKMYDYMNDNIALEMHPVNYVNDPYVIGQMNDFISVNSCIEIDFLGQACAESIGPVNFSGSGGQLDFVRGCHVSKGGKSFIAINSTAKNGTISKIKPMLTPGSAVTTGKNDIDYVVTEYGMVRLQGLSAGQRAKALISIAHPNFREELTAEAKRMNLMI